MAIKEFYFGKVSEVKPDQFTIKQIEGKSIGAILVDGEIKVLLNLCPHEGAEICKGRVDYFITSDDVGHFRVDEFKKVIICPWHKWEFELASGKPIVSGRGKVIFYKPIIRNEELYFTY